jgi:hypothetical protein
MCLSKTSSRVRVDNTLSVMFTVRNYLKQGYALSPLLFNYDLQYAIRTIQVNQGGMKLNGTHQILVYNNDVNILGGNVHNLKEDKMFDRA